ncbi:MmcQ/YjbR family DNA-binding protein [Chitinophagaceae bacterium LB-8]|uniref:MmcQ/YjbR family DNA-binding protein n=1 Tax=Paraflavisolibacter caeni TaxID=2982496 RepID=A0A9X3BHT3_9BACT|nr:MmcQ/YjbR family DNA-binding protein [Paraflavisolibacter caeni]MCU7549128.1 MmcQ/YjbR family DNA-binding protein [Paraflavisolibacter caeni]
MDLDFLRSFCLGLTACTEDVKWDNDLVFSIGGKMFCVAALDLPFKCSFKVKDEEFDELMCRPHFEPAPYMARAKWVLVTNPSVIHKDEWEAFIRQSYELVKAKLTKKLRVELGLEK